jgi:hypothetical protein
MFRNLLAVAKGLLPDRLFLSLIHRRRVGRFPRFIRPQTFNEYVVGRCLEPDSRYAALTDKLTVRPFVAERIGAQHLIPLLAAPESFTRTVFDELPKSFVMKANHGSGFVKVVHDKATVTFEELSQLANQWISTDFYKIARERHYRDIQPKIFFEELLLDDRGIVPADFKLHIFNSKSGRPTIFILLISDRFGEVPRGDVFDAKWQRQDISIGKYVRSEQPVPRPDNLDEIVATASALARDFEYVRVDLYSLRGAIYFGELTFTPGAGVLPFVPDTIDFDWGEMVFGAGTTRDAFQVKPETQVDSTVGIPPIGSAYGNNQAAAIDCLENINR